MIQREVSRKYTPLVEVTQDNLIHRRVPNPFKTSELMLLINMRDGIDSKVELCRKMGIKSKSFNRKKSDISIKVSGMYFGRGSDNLVKALSLSILGGWIEEPEYKDREAELDKLEYAVLFQRSFGHTPVEVIGELHLSPQKYNEIFLNLKGKLELSGDYQVIAWGASQAKKYLLENT